MLDSADLRVFLFAVLALSGLAAILFAAYRRTRILEQRRRDGLAAKAAALGWTFSAEGSAPEVDSIRRFALLAEGHSHRLFNRIQGERHGLPFELFDLRHILGSGKNARVHQQTVLRVPLGAGVGASWSLRPENLADAVASFFGWPDIDFEHYPVFSKRYHLKGENENAVRAIFGDRLLRALENDPFGYCLASDGRVVIVYTWNQRIEVEKLESDLDRYLTIAALFRNR